MFFSRSVLAITMKVFHLRPMCFVNIISDEFYAAWKDRILLLGSVSVESEECLSVSCVKFDEFGNAFVDLIELLETGRNVYGLIYLKKLAVHLELPTARGSLVSLR
ncbi:hypothetical protein F2Q69_00026936 [Brassica cretica]|uniref:Uncharacterized protein n=1 Tax=Brassica cretica TaxID=69181 RepID=A0A8S9S1X7_BRACR|nr:hypothetical protein F2Q69_00026936 [Brassica cretica]